MIYDNKLNYSINTGLSNYYGTVRAIKKGNDFYLELDDYGADQRKEISEVLFISLFNEFNSTIQTIVED